MSTHSISNNIDTSIYSLVMSSDALGKTVFLLLFTASLWSWTIIIYKYISFNYLEKNCKLFENAFWQSNGIDGLSKITKDYPNTLLSPILKATMKEYNEICNDSIDKEASKLRIQSIISLICEQQIRPLEKHLGFLATVSSASPFIGLFGTVWGIMHSFQSIAYSKNTSLAVVAPGIAEALLATAIGLFAAIPATIFYNYFANRLETIDNEVRVFSQNLYLVISKTLDQR
ncbi:MAG TPA: protein TolQ [Candidatus Megaira endosymbiont of Nemacystus decipiens]|nr:protein TolQ [Candidatus Megaera endosymbiont of Nemacystus decipiens]